MNYYELNISRKQAQQLAFTFIADIESYCKSHEAEFKEYLKAETKNESEVNENAS